MLSVKKVKGESDGFLRDTPKTIYEDRIGFLSESLVEWFELSIYNDDILFCLVMVQARKKC